MKMLYLQASPRLVRSHCIAIADAFVEAWRKYNTAASVMTKNIFTSTLPEFNDEAVSARYLVARGLAATDEQKSAWEAALQMVNEFKSFDKYVIASPMWNYSLPYKLKQYIDLVFQPTHTFMIKDGAYKAAVAEKPVCFFLARGGKYADGSDIDFQLPYLKHIFGLMGFKKLSFVMVEPTGQDPDKVREMHTAKIAEALSIAKDF